MTESHRLQILPSPSIATVVSRETIATETETSDGKPIHVWFQSFPLILGVTEGKFFAGIAEAPDADGLSICRMLCHARAVQQDPDLSMDIPAYMLGDKPGSGDEKRLENARDAWLALCLLAAEKCPSRADDINAFIEQEKRRFALADKYLGYADIEEDFVGHVWHHVALDGPLTASKAVFACFDPYYSNTWRVQTGERYCIQFLDSSADAATIQCIQPGWRAFGPRVPDRIETENLGEGLSWIFDELRAHLRDQTSGHEQMAIIPVFDRIAARLKYEEPFRALFLPSV